MAEYTIDKFTYDGDTYKLKSSTLKNLVDGSQTGSVRGINTIAEDSNYTIGYGAVAVGISTKASGSGAFAEGGGTQAIAIASHAEGGSTTASGEYAHAEGGGTTASGQYAHSEGSYTVASGGKDHAEGYNTTASGGDSHAEGAYTAASGLDSHAEGNETIANHLAQHVFGEYNIADASTATANKRGNYVEIVGNGAYNARSNARTLDWSGNEVLAGKLTLGAAGVNAMDAATVGQIPSVPTNVSSFTNDAGYITGYTETDPVFSASAAAGITATDISNWNGKVSDDHKWNDVSFSHTNNSGNGGVVPYMDERSSTVAKTKNATNSPLPNAIPLWDNSNYLYSATPPASDNSTKVATTAYVGSEIDNIDLGYDCDVTTTLLTNETVTTELTDGYGWGELSYTGQTTADKLLVEFNGTSYIVSRYISDVTGYPEYGAPSDGSDFSKYPFGLMLDGYSIYMATETAGTYNISVSTYESSVTTSECFEEAVKSVDAYNASSPIVIDNNNNISHETSGVTAGTYTGYKQDKSNTTYIPSFTIDEEGHVTSASNLGYGIPEASSSAVSTPGLLVPAYLMGFVYCSGSGNNYSGAISAGEVSNDTLITVNGMTTYFTIVGVEAFDAVTREPVLVDWSIDVLGVSNSRTVTVSISKPYDNDIRYQILCRACIIQGM